MVSHGPWQSLYSDKSTNSGADQLQAMGLAVLARNILLQARTPNGYVYIRDEGSHYTITLDVPIVDDFLRLPTRRARLFDPLLLASNADELAGMDPFEYEREREESAIYWERIRARQAARKGGVSPAVEEGADTKPHHQLSLYSGIRAFNLHKQVNDLARFWYRLPQDAYTEVLHALLDTFSHRPNRSDQLLAAWKSISKKYQLADITDMASQLQLTTGIAGMGANHPKADGVVKFGKITSLWLIEWLKVGGFFALSVPATVRSGREKVRTGKAKGHVKASDRKLYILRPRNASLTAIDAVLARFRESMRSTTSLRLDVLAALKFVEAFYETHLHRIDAVEASLDDPAATLPERCTAMVDGFDVVSSKNMSNSNVAFATMNLATINLPDWLPKVPIHEPLQVQKAVVQTALEIVGDHITLVRLIGWRTPDTTEEGSEEMELLRHYRNFLSARDDLRAFLEFTDAYGAYIISQRSSGRLVKQLTLSHLEVLMAHTSGDDYVQIIESRGFLNIATCIREATVKPQFLNSKPKRGVGGALTTVGSPYETRYGLSQDLSRAAQEGDGEFLSKVGDFLNAYRIENLRVMDRLNRDALAHGLLDIPLEQRKRLRPSHTTKDLDQVIKLTQQFHARLMCSLLLAYGYAKEGSDFTLVESENLEHEELPEEVPDLSE